ncbi:MAG TPA: hypothetical protein ENI29_03175 [bacterium]|nr:hypothetical protein [bacterium]
MKENKEKLIQGRIEKYNMRFFELFEILKRFLGIYDYYSRNWMEQSLILVGKKTVKQLSQKLENIKKEEAIHQFLNEKRYSGQNFKENLIQNLYKITELNLNEKSTINKIIHSEKFVEKQSVKLANILCKLSIEELILLLGEDFNRYYERHLVENTVADHLKLELPFIMGDVVEGILEKKKEDTFGMPINQYSGNKIYFITPDGDIGPTHDNKLLARNSLDQTKKQSVETEVNVVTVWNSIVQNLKGFLFRNRLISKNTIKNTITEFYGKRDTYFRRVKQKLIKGEITPYVFTEMYYKIVDSVELPVLNSPGFSALKESFRILTLLTQDRIPPPFLKSAQTERKELWEDLIYIFEEELKVRVPHRALSYILFGNKRAIQSNVDLDPRWGNGLGPKLVLPSIYNLYARIKELSPFDLYKFQHPNLKSTIALLDVPSTETMNNILKKVSDRLFQFIVENHYETSQKSDRGFSPSNFRIEFELFSRLYHIAFHLEGGDTYITNEKFEDYWGVMARERSGGTLGVDSMYKDIQSYNYLLEKVINLENSLNKDLYSEFYTFVKDSYPSFRTVRQRRLGDLAAPFNLNTEHIEQNLGQINENAPNLVKHFKFILKLGGVMPTSVKQKGIIKISSLNNKLKGFTLRTEKNIKASHIREFMDTVAKVSFFGDEDLDPMILSLLTLTQNEKYKDILAHGGASHKDVQILNLKGNPYTLAVELPVYFEYKGEIIAGHIDLLLIKDGVLYVTDYKPDQSPKAGVSNYLSFINSVPQLAAYALVLRDLLGIEQVQCITFNKDGAWSFDPDDSLIFINKFLEGQSKLDLAFWSNYLIPNS